MLIITSAASPNTSIQLFDLQLKKPSEPYTICSVALLQLVDGAMEVEVLMKRMVELQQQEEEYTQEEMATRFERERSESIPTGTDVTVYPY